MKGQSRCTALKCTFEPGAGTVLVDRATSAASAWGHVYYGCDLTRCDGRSVILLRRIPFHVSASCPSRFADLVVPLSTQWEPAIARFAMLVN
jgi:hypothetical protein